MSGAPVRNEWCKDCQGHGARWLASHMTNPSARERWETCDRCNGDGIEPKATSASDEGDEE